MSQANKPKSHNRKLNISIWQLSIATIIVPIIPGSQIGIEIYSSLIESGMNEYLATAIGVAAFIGIESVGAGAFYNATHLYKRGEIDIVFYATIVACVIYMAVGILMIQSTIGLFFVLSGVAYFNYSVYQFGEQEREFEETRIKIAREERNLINAKIRLVNAEADRNDKSNLPEITGNLPEITGTAPEWLPVIPENRANWRRLVSEGVINVPETVTGAELASLIPNVGSEKTGRNWLSDIRNGAGK